MQTEQPQGPICQSCGMPLVHDEDFGTNADNSKNEDYCCYCYQVGEFTEQDLTLEQMIDTIVKHLSNAPEEKVRELAHAVLPKLKRWAK